MSIKKLLTWYKENARVLPWRSQPTPYRVLVSEIMLQQTRVEAAISYFERFVKQLPDFRHLAAISEDDLLKLWEGLGYYSRARNLQKCAQTVLSEYGGALPTEEAQLKKLPGIGDYTAAAVRSIAYGLPAAAVDGNVLRVYTRLNADASDISLPATRKAVAAALLPLIPQERASDFTQAWMELGATVCLPNGAPRCNVCPLQAECKGKGTPDRFPVKPAPPEKKHVSKTVFLLVCGDRFALQRHPGTGVLRGMWGLPSVSEHLGEAQVQALWQQAKITRLPDCKHVFTHLIWEMRAYKITLNAQDPAFTWATEGEFAIPSAYKGVLKGLE